jgi:hypothetical protein
MAISELQIALIGAGVAAVAAVWAFNNWQARQHRKTAEKIFKGGQGDALLGADDKGSKPEEIERKEPRFAAEVVEYVPTLGEIVVAEPVAEPAFEHVAAFEPVAAVEPPSPVSQQSSQPEPPPVEALLPEQFADEVADCVLRLTTPDAIPAVRAMQNSWAGTLGKPLHWLAWSTVEGAWRLLAPDDGGRYRDWAVALQLVDRRGPIADAELARFFEGMQQLAQQAGAALELPAHDEIVQRAGKLDEFCAAVDIQFVLHVVEAAGGVFAGTKLRGVVEAAGLALEPDGVFRARDGSGAAMFTVANLGAERLDADSIKSLATHGLTLILDVPRAADGVHAFDRMLMTARQLAAALGGVLVDAQRAPLSDAMIAAIRAKTAELQQRMRDGSIVPGGTRALRLFS